MLITISSIIKDCRIKFATYLFIKCLKLNQSKIYYRCPCNHHIIKIIVKNFFRTLCNHEIRRRVRLHCFDIPRGSLHQMSTNIVSRFPIIAFGWPLSIRHQVQDFRYTKPGRLVVVQVGWGCKGGRGVKKKEVGGIACLIVSVDIFVIFFPVYKCYIYLVRVT